MMPTNPKQDGDYGAMVEGFREHLISLNRSPKTIQMYVENTQRFLKYIAKEKLEVKTVTADDIED